MSSTLTISKVNLSSSQSPLRFLLDNDEFKTIVNLLAAENVYADDLLEVKEKELLVLVSNNLTPEGNLDFSYLQKSSVAPHNGIVFHLNKDTISQFVHSHIWEALGFNNLLDRRIIAVLKNIKPSA